MTTCNVEMSETPAIRELTAAELDQVSGGLPSLGDAINWVAEKVIGQDTLNNLKDAGNALWQPIKFALLTERRPPHLVASFCHNGCATQRPFRRDVGIFARSSTPPL